MKIPVFLSISTPFLKTQTDFLQSAEDYLNKNSLEPLTLGRNNYDMDAPLEGIRRLMSISCGLLLFAFRRTIIIDGKEKPNPDTNQASRDVSGRWLTSPYCHIEPAMAYQMGIPLLLWREKDVIDDGILDRGAIGLNMPEFDLEKGIFNFDDDLFTQPFQEWKRRVQTTFRNRGNILKLY